MILTPADREGDKAYIIEFKMHKPAKEKTLEETVANALSQIEEKQYAAKLLTLPSKSFLPVTRLMITLEKHIITRIMA